MISSSRSTVKIPHYFVLPISMAEVILFRESFHFVINPLKQFDWGVILFRGVKPFRDTGPHAPTSEDVYTIDSIFQEISTPYV